jgi:hypothetical protein
VADPDDVHPDDQRSVVVDDVQIAALENDLARSRRT